MFADSDTQFHLKLISIRISCAHICNFAHISLSCKQFLHSYDMIESVGRSNTVAAAAAVSTNSRRKTNTETFRSHLFTHMSSFYLVWFSFFRYSISINIRTVFNPTTDGSMYGFVCTSNITSFMSQMKAIRRDIDMDTFEAISCAFSQFRYSYVSVALAYGTLRRVSFFVHDFDKI